MKGTIILALGGESFEGIIQTKNGEARYAGDFKSVWDWICRRAARREGGDSVTLIDRGRKTRLV